MKPTLKVSFKTYQVINNLIQDNNLIEKVVVPNNTLYLKDLDLGYFIISYDSSKNHEEE